MCIYSDLISQIADACIKKDALKFVSLFSEDGEIQLSNSQKVTFEQIETITANYFANLKYIKIDILGMAINPQENLAFVEWIWSDYNLEKETENSHQNTIVIEFKDNLIYRWREYKL